MTRWQQLCLMDPRVQTAPPSQYAQAAADYFWRAHKWTILDLGCGAGRDMAVLVNNGLRVTGVDAAVPALFWPNSRHLWQSQKRRSAIRPRECVQLRN